MLCKKEIALNSALRFFWHLFNQDVSSGCFQHTAAQTFCFSNKGTLGYCCLLIPRVTPIWFTSYNERCIWNESPVHLIAPRFAYDFFFEINLWIQPHCITLLITVYFLFQWFCSPGWDTPLRHSEEPVTTVFSNGLCIAFDVFWDLFKNYGEEVFEYLEGKT